MSGWQRKTWSYVGQAVVLEKWGWVAVCRTERDETITGFHTKEPCISRRAISASRIPWSAASLARPRSSRSSGASVRRICYCYSRSAANHPFDALDACSGQANHLSLFTFHPFDALEACSGQACHLSPSSLCAFATLRENFLIRVHSRSVFASIRGPYSRSQSGVNCGIQGNAKSRLARKDAIGR